MAPASSTARLPPAERLAIGFAIAVCVAIPWLNPNFHPGAGRLYGGDALHEYVGAYIVLRGDRRRLYDLAYVERVEHDPAVVGFRWDEQRYMPLNYPAFYFVALAPLALLSYRTAVWLWYGLMVGCLALAALLARRHLAHGPRWLFAAALPAAMLFRPLVESLVSNQKGTLLLLIVAATYALLRRRQPLRAGLVFATMAFKPHLPLLIGLVMVLKRRVRFVAGAALMGAALVAVSLAVGREPSLAYLRRAVHFGVFIDTPGMPLTRLHNYYGFFRLLLAGQPLWLVQLATLAALGLTAFQLWRLLRGVWTFDDPAGALRFSGLVFATTLCSPHLLAYDLTILLLPTFLLAERLAAGDPLLDRQRRRLRWTLIALYMLCTLSPTLPQITSLQLTVPTMGVLLWMLGSAVAPARR